MRRKERDNQDIEIQDQEGRMNVPKKEKATETSTEILLLGFLCVKGVETLREKINILDRFGLADADIATICDCARQSVKDARQKNKKSG